MQFNTSFAFRQRKTETRHSLKKCAAIKEKKERKGKWTCIAPIVSISTTKRSDADHTELPANTPHLPKVNVRVHN